MSAPTVLSRLLLSAATLVAVGGCSTGPPTSTSSPATPDASNSAPAPTGESAAASTGESTADSTGEQRFPDVVGVEISGERSAGLSFAVTISSPYDSPERYADGIRVRSADGTVFGETTLTHGHASEQPFTRSVTGVKVPDGVTEVVVEARDQANGWGGGTKTVTLP